MVCPGAGGDWKSMVMMFMPARETRALSIEPMTEVASDWSPSCSTGKVSHTRTARCRRAPAA